MDEAWVSGEMVHRQAIDRQSMSWVVAGEFHLYLWKEAGVAVLGRKMVAGNVIGLPGVCGASATESVQSEDAICHADTHRKKKNSGPFWAVSKLIFTTKSSLESA